MFDHAAVYRRKTKRAPCALFFGSIREVTSTSFVAPLNASMIPMLLVLMLLLAYFVVGLANFFLDLAGILFDIAGQFACVIAGYLAGRFFRCTFDFVLGPFNTIFIHDLPPDLFDGGGVIMRKPLAWFGADRVKSKTILLSTP